MGPIPLKNIILELNEALAGGIISKIHQPNDRDIVLKVFIRGHDERLIISTHPRFSRVHLTKEGFVNPPAPKRFCAYLRSRIENARIEGVTQVDIERIARIGLKKRTEGEEHLTLVAELTGKSSNIILVDDKETVLDALKYFPPETSVRVVMPGVPLKPLPPKPAGEPEKEAFTREEAVTWNEAADRYYAALIKEDEETAGSARIRRALNEAEKRLKRKLQNLSGDKKRAEEGLVFTKTGELLAANLGRIKRGDKEVKVTDYTKAPPEEVTIALDEKLSPKENLDKCFKRAKKGKAALLLLKDRIPQAEEELSFIEELKYELTAAETEEDLKELEEELIREGYLKGMVAPRAAPIKEIERVEPVRRLTSSEGFELLCGKSSIGNDLIVKKYAKDEDIWFHASKVPGSHVLIKVAGRGKELTRKTIEEAAALAAWHSKAKNASKAEVVYTEARHVRKPRGARPGMVTVKEYKTIVVRPREMG